VVAVVNVHNLTEEECRSALQEILDRYSTSVDEIWPDAAECRCCMTDRAKELGVSWDDWDEIGNWLFLLGED